jgi:crossover junction endodeoxyribonuclease RuvC
MIAVGVVRTPVGDEPQERLLTLQTEIDAWLAEHRPDAVAVERVFAKANIRGIMGTAQASAVPMLAAARLGLPLALHTPTEVKAAVTGNGRADKAQVTAMITRLLGLHTAPKPADAADALALAICHLWRGQSDARLGVAAGENAFLRAAQAAGAGAGTPRNRLEELHAAHTPRRAAGAPRAQIAAVRRSAR